MTLEISVLLKSKQSIINIKYTYNFTLEHLFELQESTHISYNELIC